MKQLEQSPLPQNASPPWPLATALRETFREGYTFSDFRQDAAGGIVTGIVAVPLSMALAIAVGVPPQHGLYTAIVAGGLTALLGGAKTSVSGPTAAFVVILAPIAARYGIAGLCIASTMAGIILILLGIAKLGKLIEFVPHPVTTGFTSGIAVVIATLQIKDFLGLQVEHMPDQYVERLLVLGRAVPSLNLSDLVVGIAALAMLIIWPQISQRIPAALLALFVVAVVSFAVQRVYPDFNPGTINDGRFVYTTAAGEQAAGIPNTPPVPILPWHLPGPDAEPLVFNLDLIRALLMPAFAIAMLGAIESLLCAVVADGMTGEKHDPDSELIAQGLGNISASFFSGFAATGAIARTATAIRAGAKSPIASFIHAAFVLLAILVLSPLLGYLPMASLAALMLIVAWNMSDIRHFAQIVRVAPRSDIAVLLTCFLLTVFFDMVVSVVTGVMLSAVLFMGRMAQISGTRLVSGTHPQLAAPLPQGVLLYEVHGPLFFGAAEKAASAILTADRSVKAIILHMVDVPIMDVTGLVALQSAIDKLQHGGVYVVLAEVQQQPSELLRQAGLTAEPGKLAICNSLEQAETMVRLILPEHRSDKK